MLKIYFGFLHSPDDVEFHLQFMKNKLNFTKKKQEILSWARYISSLLNPKNEIKKAGGLKTKTNRTILTDLRSLVLHQRLTLNNTPSKK